MKKILSFFVLFLFLLGGSPHLFAQTEIEHLIDNRYNAKGLPVGEFSTVLKMVKDMEVSDRSHLMKILKKEDVTLYEVSYGLYYLGLSYLKEGDVEHGVKLLHASAEDYLNPMALSEMARIYYHGDEELHHIFPKEHLEGVHLGIEQNIEKSFVTLNLAFEIAHEVHKKYNSSEILKLVSRDGVELLERFTFNNETDQLKDTEEHRKTLAEDLKKDLELLETYKKMYHNV